MIFTSQKAADRWARRHISSRMIFMNNLEEWQQSAVMCDTDVRKPIRMRQYAREALDALDSWTPNAMQDIARRRPTSPWTSTAPWPMFRTSSPDWRHPDDRA